ncbi:MAG: flagellar hook-length control protein FliK [Caldimicrobium sp.]|nr:flagellar hook-length control protein FliK [Caldimicrobium sp.]MCX7874231.1 flagellar hook-length control protein FliK [Caldimicrobium sp.]MDW8094760.1 flagellar hook-length control protein FliK [Caldimicrobium sp.]
MRVAIANITGFNGETKGFSYVQGSQMQDFWNILLSYLQQKFTANSMTFEPQRGFGSSPDSALLEDSLVEFVRTVDYPILYDLGFISKEKNFLKVSEVNYEHRDRLPFTEEAQTWFSLLQFFVQLERVIEDESLPMQEKRFTNVSNLMDSLNLRGLREQQSPTEEASFIQGLNANNRFSSIVNPPWETSKETLRALTNNFMSAQISPENLRSNVLSLPSNKPSHRELMERELAQIVEGDLEITLERQFHKPIKLQSSMDNPSKGQLESSNSLAMKYLDRFPINETLKDFLKPYLEKILREGLHLTRDEVVVLKTQYESLPLEAKLELTNLIESFKENLQRVTSEKLLTTLKVPGGIDDLSFPSSPTIQGSFPVEIEKVKVDKPVGEGNQRALSNLSIENFIHYVKELTLRTLPSGEKRALLHLEPPELGKMEIQVKVHEREVEIVAKVEKIETLSQLQQELSQIKTQLEDLNLRLREFQVSLGLSLDRRERGEEDSYTLEKRKEFREDGKVDEQANIERYLINHSGYFYRIV